MPKQVFDLAKLLDSDLKALGIRVVIQRNIQLNGHCISVAVSSFAYQTGKY